MPNPIKDILSGKSPARWAVEKAKAIPWMRSLPPDSVDLVFFSPPYEAARTYGLEDEPLRRGEEWVAWMRETVVEASRISRGLVAVNMAGQVRDRSYSLAPEKLAVDLVRHDELVCWPSPYVWVKMEDRDGALPNGIPGSGGRDSQRRDWEPVYCFTRPENIPLAWTDNLAFGARTREGSFGGDFSNRSQDGKRANDHAREMSKPVFNGGKDGSVKGGHRRVRPEVSNPGNVIGMGEWLRVPVGGGKLGDPLAHKNHAPMPLGLAERFVCWFCPPDGIVCDPFLGSGTTIHAALKHGRRGIGCDINAGEGGLKTAIERLKLVERNL